MFVSVEYKCPGGGYTRLTKNVDADANYVMKVEVAEKKVSIEKCSVECDKEPTCDFFMYLHENQQCDMWNFKRRSNLLQIGLTDDAIFCIKHGNDINNNSIRCQYNLCNYYRP